MVGKWHRRAAHTRRGQNGQIISVNASTVFTNSSSGKKAAYRHACPECGAQIVTVNMRNGGWAHFEGGRGLGRIKHACFDRGKGLSKRRDKDTPDLFEKQSIFAETHLRNAFNAALTQYQETMGELFPIVPKFESVEDSDFWAVADIDTDMFRIRVSTGTVDATTTLWESALADGGLLSGIGQPLSMTTKEMTHLSLVWLMLHELHHYQMGHFEITGRLCLTEANVPQSYGIVSRAPALLPVLAGLDEEGLAKIEPCLEMQADHDAIEMLLDAYSADEWPALHARATAISGMMMLIEREDTKRSHAHSSHPKAATRIFQLLGHLIEMPMIKGTLAQQHPELEIDPAIPSDEEQSAFNREVAIPAFLNAIKLALVANAETISDDLGEPQDFFRDVQIAKSVDSERFDQLITEGAKQWASIQLFSARLLWKT